MVRRDILVPIAMGTIKKTTFDFEVAVARRLAELKQAVQFDEGLAPSKATGVAIVSALILNASARQIAKFLKASLNE